MNTSGPLFVVWRASLSLVVRPGVHCPSCSVSLTDACPPLGLVLDHRHHHCLQDEGADIHRRQQRPQRVQHVRLPTYQITDVQFVGREHLCGRFEYGRKLAGRSRAILPRDRVVGYVADTEAER